jgi:hypothetical protein
MKRCKVSATDASGKRHTIEIEAKSVYSAILHFNAEAISRPAYGLPKTADETVFEVEVDGVIHRRTLRQAMAWANARSGWRARKSQNGA